MSMRGSFAGLPEDQVILMAQQGNGEAMEYLLKRHIDIVYSKAKVFYIKGLDKDDVVQEGLVGLYKAIRDFQFDREASFRGFAHICVYRHLISAVKTANRQKHIPLNTFTSIDKQLKYGREENSGRTLQEVIADERIDPENEIINQELIKEVSTTLREMLTPLEWKVFISYLDNKTYQEISRELNSSIKTVDNALQRSRRKINQIRYKLNGEDVRQLMQW